LEATHLPDESKRSNSVLTPRKEAPWMMCLVVVEAVSYPHITVFPTTFLQPYVNQLEALFN
jgi:antibiotic biosynthesis monooxygenase (ABM) superfamily enzyme